MTRNFISAVTALLFALLVACAPATTPREQARGVVLTLADGVAQADEACALVAVKTKDLATAKACADGYDEARNALLVAEEGLDAWDAASIANLPCAAKAALAGLDKIVDRVARAGGNVPPVAVDARKLATVLTEACRG